MPLSYESEFSCPYCMAPNMLEIDALNDIEQSQIVDCQVCCQPIEITVHENMDGDFEIIARTDDE
ncbi:MULTISPECIES: CPXCG motif-containing cysteine-rich protein [Gammaproteobacteria]|uniref:CPXCG motif-containing cysteine-rich protein n=1 Tax=Gammaproteobacteria TaxID=1236 RepID=UPI000DD00241|nr:MULTISPECIES: CPXCG motif-containing cysteine-rich protein [Gammaproteobacteria]RTE85856.1 CPXCG motif-containing cysteine-rich protein [Aliidiomarina sp. B3213]TCZ90144.1 CPXCG motif-containing cysteine-rich protein [Lysobacter sp. N42]